jgi:hypothetical protein
VPLKAFPGFVDGSYRFPYSPLLGVDTCRNLQPKRLGPNGPNKMAFVLPPGKELKTTFAASPGRGAWSSDTNLIYCVSGDRLYSYDAVLGTVVDRSALPGGTTIGNDNNPVRWAQDGNSRLGIQSNRRLWVDSGLGPVEVITPASPGATPAGNGVAGLCFVGGYGVIFEIDTNKVYVSAINDLTTWDVADVQIWFSTSDRLSQLTVDVNNRLWLWGRKSIEPWSQLSNPGTGFPFGRIPGAGLNIGLAAQFGVGLVPQVAGTDLQVFLSNSERGTLAVYVLQGYQAVRISNDAMEEIIDNYAISEDCVLNGYGSPGQRMACFSFPDAGIMWVYDFATGVWHDRFYGPYGSEAEPLGRFHVCPVNVRVRNHFWLSGTTGKLYLDNPTIFQDDGAPIYWERTTPNISNDLQEVTLGAVALDVNVGEGASVSGISMEMSNDNGETYGAARSRSTGISADYRRKVQWEKSGGTSNSFVLRFRGNDNRKLAIVGASIDIDADLGY